MGTGTISRPDERTSSDGRSQSFPAKSQEITAVALETYPRFVWIDVHSLEFPRIPTVFTTLFVRFLVLVLESIQYSNPTFWSASSREPPSSTSTVSLSTVRRDGLSTSTTKSDARHDLWLIVWADRRFCSDRISRTGYLLRTRRVVARMQCVCE